MEERFLHNFETFNEFPDKCLKVNNSSSYFYIKKDDNAFVA